MRSSSSSQRILKCSENKKKIKNSSKKKSSKKLEKKIFIQKLKEINSNMKIKLKHMKNLHNQEDSQQIIKLNRSKELSVKVLKKNSPQNANLKFEKTGIITFQNSTVNNKFEQINLYNLQNNDQNIPNSKHESDFKQYGKDKNNSSYAKKYVNNISRIKSYGNKNPNSNSFVEKLKSKIKNDDDDEKRNPNNINDILEKGHYLKKTTNNKKSKRNASEKKLNSSVPNDLEYDPLGPEKISKKKIIQKKNFSLNTEEFKRDLKEDTKKMENSKNNIIFSSNKGKSIPKKHQEYFLKNNGYLPLKIKTTPKDQPKNEDNQIKTNPEKSNPASLSKKKMPTFIFDDYSNKNEESNNLNESPQLKDQNKKRATSVTLSNTEISSNKLEKIGISKKKSNYITIIKQKEKSLPMFTKARTVVKSFGKIKAFVVNTHKGIVRTSNEDRVSILLNAQNKFVKLKSPISSCAMFTVFDGHGGTDCCNYMKDNLHNKILLELDVQGNFNKSIKKIYKDIDLTYLKRAAKKKQNYAGSCANSVFIIDDELVVVNTGDSRTICSKKGGEVVEELSNDHKPSNLDEFQRIIKNGGQLYRVSSNLKTIENVFYTVTKYQDVIRIDEMESSNKNLCFGPWRIKPGGLSVSRSFGDFESKILKNGQQIHLVIPEPEILRYPIDDMDFCIMASDGVYDKLTNKQIIDTVWETFDYYKDICKNVVEKKKMKERSSSIKSGMKSSMNSATSSKIKAHAKKVTSYGSYSKFFDKKIKNRENSRNKNSKSSFKNLDSQKSLGMNSKASLSQTSIKIDEDMEDWEKEMRRKYEDILGDCVNNILKRALISHSDDNVTLIMLVFSDLIKK